MKKFISAFIVVSLLLSSCATTVEKDETLTPSFDSGGVDSISTVIKLEDNCDISSAFSYLYGVTLMENIESGKYSPSIPYLALGMYDATLGITYSRFFTILELYELLNSDSSPLIGRIYEKRPETLSELCSLPYPPDMRRAISYALGRDIMRENIESGDELLIIPLLAGLFDTYYSGASPLGEEERERIREEYVIHEAEEYYRKREEESVLNNEKAESFLEKNREKKDVITLDNGVQMMILERDETTGPSPTQYDRVILDYNTYILSYDTLELEIIDADVESEVSAIDLEAGVQSALVKMHTGEAWRIFIPPRLAPDDVWSSEFPPSVIFVYDIALERIL